jgi:hypothetical protein
MIWFVECRNKTKIAHEEQPLKGRKPDHPIIENIRIRDFGITGG